jgi:hypothetical protein
MPLTTLTADVENITKLDDNPTQQAGMTPALLKSRFDKGAADIKSFINGTLIPELTAALGDKLSSIELTAASQAILASAQASGLFDGNGVASVSLLSGTHAPGTTDTYRITFTDNTTYDFTVYNGADGLGQGDMLASVYDPTSKNADAFSMTNMTEGTTNKIFTAAERAKLAGIAAGADANVNADWNAASGAAQILNKPAIDTVVRSATAPSNLAALWIDTGSGYIPKYFNGSAWVPLVAVWG